VAASPPLGLRERKKIKLRRSVQRAALRLFEEHGYDATTVEQIADAADISTSTFYRYFPAKEDVVFDDDFDPIFSQILGQPGDDTLIASVRAAIAAVAVVAEDNREQMLTRLKLCATVPALRARQAAEGDRSFDFFIELFAARTGRPIGDYRLRLVTATFSAALVESARYWGDIDGARSLGALQDEAITLLEPLFAAL
jgi:AcrR family transcriptional regulator